MASHFVGCSTAPFHDNAAAEPGPLYFTHPGDMFLARLATSPSSLVFTDSGLHAGLVKRRPRSARKPRLRQHSGLILFIYTPLQCSIGKTIEHWKKVAKFFVFKSQNSPIPICVAFALLN